MKYTLTLLMTEFVTHDVKRFILSKPDGFEFQPGQGVELAIKEAGWEQEARPFTPTSLPQDRVLEFTIKGYQEHNGVTRRLHTLPPGAQLLMSDPFGTIHYKGPGTFIAAGAGITPFIAILRDLARSKKLTGHALLYSNKTPADVICEQEFRHYLGERCLLSCTRDSAPGYERRRFDQAFLEEHIKDFSRHFYVCGPPAFTSDCLEALKVLGAKAESLVFER
ncbi:MAG: FAD-binding oxidoreductase [Pseudomonadota bacterium]